MKGAAGPRWPFSGAFDVTIERCCFRQRATRGVPVGCCSIATMVRIDHIGTLLLGIGGISGNELLFFVLPLLLAMVFVAWLVLSIVKAITSISESLANISRSLAKIASRGE